MFVYVSLIILTVVFDLLFGVFRSDKVRGLFFLFLIIFATYISSIRYGIGTDYWIYDRYYSIINSYGIGATEVERGFAYLCKLLINFGFTSQSLFILSSIFVNAVLGFFISKTITSRYWCFAFFLYICGGFYFNSLNLLRQFIAISFGILALYAYSKKKMIVFSLSLVAALLFHTSAFVLLLFILLERVMRSPKKFQYVFLLFIASVVLSVIGVNGLLNYTAVLTSRWAWYIDSETSNFFTERNTSAVMKIFVPAIVVGVGFFQDYVAQKKDVKIAKDVDSLHTLISAGALAYILLQIIGYGIAPIFRIGLYFFPFFIIYTCKVISRQKKYLQFGSWFILICYFILLTCVTVFLWNGSGVMPYQSIFGIDKII